MKRKLLYCLVAVALAALCVYPVVKTIELGSCAAYALGGFRQVASDRADRFLGKVDEDTARCRGGDLTAALGGTPWIDWQRYRRAAGPESVVGGIAGRMGFLSPNRRA